MAGEDLLVPVPPLGPQELGLPDPPQAPAPFVLPAPTGQDLSAKILKLLAVGLASKLGPGAGTGILQGLSAADQTRAATQQRAELVARQTAQQQQTDYEQAQRVYTQEADQRQRTIQTNLEALRRVAPTLKTKADYDRYVDTYTAGMQSRGLRVTSNW